MGTCGMCGISGIWDGIISKKDGMDASSLQNVTETFSWTDDQSTCLDDYVCLLQSVSCFLLNPSYNCQRTKMCLSFRNRILDTGE